MRESEELIDSYSYWSDELSFVREVVIIEDAKHAVNLAYKEGYKEALVDVLDKLREDDSRLLMASAIVLVRQMFQNLYITLND